MSLNNEIGKKSGGQAPANGKSYHAPRIEDYGAVNELSKSAPDTAPYNIGDGVTSYSSIAT